MNDVDKMVSVLIGLLIFSFCGVMWRECVFTNQDPFYFGLFTMVIVVFLVSFSVFLVKSLRL